jgi:hypothetical protein
VSDGYLGTTKDWRGIDNLSAGGNEPISKAALGATWDEVVTDNVDVVD